MRTLGRFLLSTVYLSAAALALAAPAGETKTTTAHLTFVKTFKGSVPEYMRVSVQESGEAVFEGRQKDESTDPERFRLSAPVTARLFALAGELNYFRGIEVETPAAIAYLGTKTFVYEKDGQRAEVSFNYTQNASAQELQEWFERIARGRFLLRELDFRLSFDRLGVLETLRELERDFNAARLVDWEEFVPLLERIASDRRLMRLAQTRATALLRRIQGAPARLQYEYGDQNSGRYYKVVTEERGSTTYESRRFDQPANPQPLAVPEAAVGRLWALVRQANHLRGLSASGEPPGRLSGYRLTYEGGAEHNEVAFSTPPTAVLAEIAHLFHQVLQQESFRQRLRAAREEGGVGLQVVLQELEAAALQDGLAEPQEFVPLLEEIANSSAQHPLARQQAQSLLTRLRAPGPSK